MVMVYYIKYMSFSKHALETDSKMPWHKCLAHCYVRMKITN